MPYLNQAAGQARGSGGLGYAGSPVNGVDEIQRVTITGSPGGGSFKLIYKGRKTGIIAYNASAATVETALEAHPYIGTGNVSCGGGALPDSFVTVTFIGALSGLNIALMTADGALLTGGTSPTVAVTTTTAGVAGTARGAAVGALLRDTETGAIYSNQGTPEKVDWGAGADLPGVTASAAELNTLDGLTASTAELNILDGVTATAAELNALDGITAGVAELNILDGVTRTAAQINAATANAQQAHIAALGSTSNLVGVDGVGDNAAPLAGTETRLDAIEAKLDATIAAIQAAAITAAS